MPTLNNVTAPTPGNPTAAKPLVGSRILVVDDDECMRSFIVVWLRALGAEVGKADGPQAAEAVLNISEYDLILSDVHMPGNHLLSWTESLLQKKGCPPVLLMTADPQLESALRAANLPVAGYLTKPLNLPDLLPRLQRELSLSIRQTRLRFLVQHSLGKMAEDTSEQMKPEFRAQIQELVGLLSENSPAGFRRSAQLADWQSVIREAIATLEKTRTSFRSSELGDLRKKLVSALAQSECA